MLSLFITAALATTTPHADFERAVRDGRVVVPERAPVAATPPTPTPGPTVKVYGYQAYWAADLDAVPWDDLSHLAIFSAGSDSAGNLSYTSRWDSAAEAVSRAAPYGVRVHLCVTNFSTSSLDAFLGDPVARQNLIDQLVGWQASTGAHGVNIDFEGVPGNRRQEMVDFVVDLEAAVGEVALATPAVDWSDAWDVAALSQHADLFIMGYGYHWSGSAEAGPTDPLYSGTGTVWSAPYSLEWTVADYLAKGADPERVILGLPLYGNSYPTADNDVPTANLGTGSAIFMAEANQLAATYGALYEPTSESPYTWDGFEQTWYPTADSVLTRIDFVLAEGIGGFGFWALHYDDGDPVLWGGIHDRTADLSGTTGSGTGTGTGTGGGTGTGTGGPGTPLVADAGLPFLAYVGDTVVLSGQGSTGPEPLGFAWKQVGGPTVALQGAQTANPTFVVEATGTHVFELVVSDGVAVSEPAYSYVLVPDVERGGCACDGGGASGPWWAAVPVALAAIRRRRR